MQDSSIGSFCQSVRPVTVIRRISPFLHLQAILISLIWICWRLKDFWIKKEYVSVNWGDDVSRIDYGRLYEQRYPVLKLAAKRFLENEPEDFETFCELQAFWLEDYALFMTLKDAHGGCSWWQWEDELKRRDHLAIDKSTRNKWLNRLLSGKCCSISSSVSGRV